MLRKKEKEHKLEKNTDFKKVLKKAIIIVSTVLSLLVLGNSYRNFWAEALEENTTQFQDIGGIEEKIFHEKYEIEPIEKRLARLEEFIFKATHQNENFDERIKKIKNAFLPKEEIKNKIPDQITIYKRPSDLPKKQYTHTQGLPSVKTYSVDPNTDFLIDELTGETVKDSYGNQIKVSLPRQIPSFNPPTNQFNPYLSLPQYPNLQYPSLMQQVPNYLPNQVPPLDLLLNQYGLNNEDPGGF